MDAIETMTFGGITAELHYDEDPMSPREWDNLSVMVDWHRRDNVLDRHINEQERRALDEGGGKLLERYLRIFHHAVAFEWVGLLDHSGWHIWVGGGSHWSDSGGWDSGTVGFAYVTRERCEELGVEPNPEVTTEQLKSEVEELDMYFRGDVYGVVIEDENSPSGGDSCWGFFGYEYAKEEMERMLHEYVEATYGLPMELEV